MSLPSRITRFEEGYRFHFSGDGDRSQLSPKEVETDLNGGKRKHPVSPSTASAIKYFKMFPASPQWVLIK